MTYAHNLDFQINERRRKVAVMDAKAMTETAIAQELGVDQATISRDLKFIKQKSQQFIFELAKSDLPYRYKQKLDSLDEVKRVAWNICNNTNEETLNIDKVKLLALKLIIMADETGFRLLNEGPSVLALRSMEERLSNVEAADEELQQQE